MGKRRGSIRASARRMLPLLQLSKPQSGFGNSDHKSPAGRFVPGLSSLLLQDNYLMYKGRTQVQDGEGK